MINIHNLCDSVISYQTNIQVHNCLAGKESRFALQPLESQSNTQEAISLADLLKKDSPITLTRKQRYSIALTIASSHLQLHSTPWIASHWLKTDIFFHLSNDGPILDQPYVSQYFTSASTSLPTPTSNTDPLSSLGILLLELCFGIPLEEHPTRLKYPAQAKPFLDLAAAFEWSPRATAEAGAEFGDAIVWCMRSGRGGMGSGREEVMERVVGPLRWCCEQFDGIV